MWKVMRTLALSGLILSVAPVWADQNAGPIETVDPFLGEWTVAVVPDQQSEGEGQAAFDEALLFHNGEFSAAAFAMFGFAPASYSVNADTGQYVFTATLVSSDRGTLTWTGQLASNGFTGQLVWDKQDGHVHHYVLTGSRPAAD